MNYFINDQFIYDPDIGIATIFVAYGQVSFWLVPSYRQAQVINTITINITDAIE